MYIVTAVPNLILDKPIMIGDIFFSSILAINSCDNNKIPDEFFTIIESNKNIWAHFASSFAIYKINSIPQQMEIPDMVDKLIVPVDMAIDCIRIELNSFSYHEQMIGTPGFYKGIKLIIILNDDYTVYKICRGRKLYYSMREGFGCDAQDYQPSEETKRFLLLDRKDEVYLKYRHILHRVCESMQIYDVDSCFAYLFSVIEGMDCGKSFRFQKKKIRILSFISENQKEFDVLSEQFYFYSKEIRTKIIHAGKSLYDFFFGKKIYEILDDLFLLIVRFCRKVIESGETTFSSLNERIEERVELFQYSLPNVDITVDEMPLVSNENCDYLSWVPNLSIEKCLKIGNVIFLPVDISKSISKLRIIYEYGIRICLKKNLDEEKVRIDTSFPYSYLFSSFNEADKSFTVWDVDFILTTVYYNIKQTTYGVTAIITNQPYWYKLSKKFSSNHSFQFADMICNTIQKALNYMILINIESHCTRFPSRVGVNEVGIRAAAICTKDSNYFNDIPGRVYGEYKEPRSDYTPDFTNASEILYKCLYDERYDEVFIINQKALHRLAECMYSSDITQKLIAIFDALDMLHPLTFDGDKLIKRVAAFSSNKEEERLGIIDYQKMIRDKVRNPIIHSGKNIDDLIFSREELLEIINKIAKLIIKYCVNVYELGVESFIDLKKIQANRLKKHN